MPSSKTWGHSINRRNLLLASVAALAPSSALRAQEESRPAVSAAAGLLLQEMSRQGIPGLSAAIARRGRIVWEASFGLADLENLVPVTPRTRFRLASISKPITAVAAMLLWEEKDLDLDAPIQQYVPSFPVKQWPINLRLLLGHQAGIRHYRNPAEAAATQAYSSVTEALEQFKNDPLLHEPGTKYHYTTYGFNLIGAAVEAVAGMPFAEFVRRRIFIPAGMRETIPDIQAQIIPGRAEGYFRDASGRLKNSALADVSNKLPGGGFIGTARDLCLFASAFHEGRLVSAGTRELMLQPGRLAGGTATTYGLGWSLSATGAEPASVGHGGGQPRVATLLLTYPALGVTTALMCNLQGAVLQDLARSLAEVFAVGPAPGTAAPS